MRKTYPTECPACGEVRKHYARGWCSNCYHRWLQRGTTDYAVRAPKVPKGKCAVGFCNRQATILTWCKGHYQQQWLGKPFKPLRTQRILHTDAEGRVCTTCDEYKVWEQFSMNNNGNRRSICRQCNSLATLERLRVRESAGIKCSECNEPASIRGMCQMHYGRWYRAGGTQSEAEPTQ